MKGSRSPHAREPVRVPVQFQTDSPAHILVVEDDIFFRRLNIIMAPGTLLRKEFTRYRWLRPAVTLLKPYTAQEMLRTVKQVLREADRAAASTQRFLHRDMKDNKIAQAGTPAGAPRPRPTNSARRILVVDGDRDLRQLYAEALAGHGYHVDGAEDGAAAWEALRGKRYHLLITEHEIPNLTGVELVKKLRGARMALPVVMAAGRLPTHELARNPSLQLAATLAKPFAIDALLDTVKDALRATETAREEIEPLPVSANASRQPMVCGCKDLNPHSKIQLTIKHPDTELGEGVKISRRGHPQ